MSLNKERKKSKGKVMEGMKEHKKECHCRIDGK
jgi:hypothetical protein